jgi:hypothetical protein
LREDSPSLKWNYKFQINTTKNREKELDIRNFRDYYSATLLRAIDLQ